MHHDQAKTCTYMKRRTVVSIMGVKLKQFLNNLSLLNIGNFVDGEPVGFSVLKKGSVLIKSADGLG